MTDVWLPGAHRDPGRNAGYNSGRSQMLRAVAHFTVGADSRSVGQRGYFHFLVHRSSDRENGLTQYAEVDAITWHAADAGNPYGPGIEFERLVTGPIGDEGLSEAEPLTDNQIEWGSKLVVFLGEWGIEPRLYDGPRYGPPVMPGGRYCGWANHQALDRDRSDGLTAAEFTQLTSPTPPPAPEPEDDLVGKISIIRNTATAQQFAYDGMTKEYLESNDRLQVLLATGHITQAQIDHPIDLLAQQVDAIPDR